MSRRIEYINPAGLRLDGRRPREFRYPKISMGIAGSKVDGSCQYEVGGTTIVATVIGPREGGRVGRSDGAAHQGSLEEGSVGVEVGLVAFAGERRANRTMRKSRQTEHISNVVSGVLNSTVLLGHYPTMHIQVHVEVVQADGSEVAACILGAALAVADANVAMQDVPMPMITGLLENHVVADLTNTESRSGAQHALVVVAAHQPADEAMNNILWLDVEARASSEVLDGLVSTGVSSALAMYQEVVEPAIKQHAVDSLSRRGVQGFIHTVGAGGH